MIVGRHLAFAAPYDGGIVHDLHHLVDDRKVVFIPFACFTVNIAVYLTGVLIGIAGILFLSVVPENAGDTVFLRCLEVLSGPLNTSLCVSEVGSTHFADYYGNVLIDEHIAEVLEVVSKVVAELLCEGVVVSTLFCLCVHCEVVRSISMDGNRNEVVILGKNDLIEEGLVRAGNIAGEHKKSGLCVGAVHASDELYEVSLKSVDNVCFLNRCS